jgi:hypothetical protein
MPGAGGSGAEGSSSADADADTAAGPWAAGQVRGRPASLPAARAVAEPASRAVAVCPAAPSSLPTFWFPAESASWAAPAFPPASSSLPTSGFPAVPASWFPSVPASWAAPVFMAAPSSLPTSAFRRHRHQGPPCFTAAPSSLFQARHVTGGETPRALSASRVPDPCPPGETWTSCPHRGPRASQVSNAACTHGAAGRAARGCLACRPDVISRKNKQKCAKIKVLYPDSATVPCRAPRRTSDPGTRMPAARTPQAA